MTNEAFTQLVDAHYAPLYRFALSLARNGSDAGDLVQQTFFIWATKGHGIRELSKAKSWLFTTLYREFLCARRRDSRSSSLEDLPPGENEPIAEDAGRLTRIDSAAVLSAPPALGGPSPTPPPPPPPRARAPPGGRDGADRRGPRPADPHRLGSGHVRAAGGGRAVPRPPDALLYRGHVLPGDRRRARRSHRHGDVAPFPREGPAAVGVRARGLAEFQGSSIPQCKRRTLIMTIEEARFILSAYRPNGSDSDLPAFGDALRMAAGDPELGAWFARSRAHDAAVSLKLRQIEPPPGLREAILAGARVSDTQRSRAPGMAWIAGLAAAAALAIVVFSMKAPARPEAGTAALAAFAINDMANERHRSEKRS